MDFIKTKSNASRNVLKNRVPAAMEKTEGMITTSVDKTKP